MSDFHPCPACGAALNVWQDNAECSSADCNVAFENGQIVAGPDELVNPVFTEEDARRYGQPLAGLTNDDLDELLTETGIK